MEKLYEGIKILDLTSNIAGPIASSMMADFGAEVIKVERPVSGEDTRMVLPQVEGFAFTSWWLNRGKKSITVNMRDPEGIKFLKKMIPHMDIIMESFRPGTMASMGLSYEEVKILNPSIIYVSISMFGQTGKDSMKPGYDLLAQARSGLLDITGEKGGIPIKSGFYISDYCASTFVYGGMASALYYKEKTGKGQLLDISLLDAIFSYNSNFEMGALNMFPTRVGNHAPHLAPYGVFEGSNHEYVAIVAAYISNWTKLCNLMGRPELITEEAFSTPAKRVQNLQGVVDAIESWLKTFPDIREPARFMDEADIPCSLIYNTKDIRSDEHLLSRGMIVDFESPTGVKSIDSVKARGVVIKMSETPGSISKCPMIGEHNNEIMLRYGLSKEKIKELQGKWTEEYYNKKNK
ncbi:Acetyl-CoA:oxalate CoA-transferase [bioreactor metagenome]|uniref:Acetyl-CoA:oxalate CoA-transferase n=1 Tax=bioreactor metagenome TaxID=1076179 RepID=A0A644VYJ1_9ZZZZ